FCLTPASRTIEPFGEQFGEAQARAFDRVVEAEVARLRHLQPGKTAGVDGIEGREVHVHVERHAVKRKAARYADAERRDLGAIDIDTGCTRPAFAAPAQQIDHRLLQHRDELLNLYAAPRQVHQRV